jgi:hypothetical protein
MKIEKRHTYEKVILGLELCGFAAVIAISWLDEFVDIPYRYFGALKTPLRPEEFWFEASAIAVMAALVIAATIWTFRRLRTLEKLVQICAWCRKVNLGDEWISLEQYLKLEHDLQSTHGICPNCRSDPAARKPRASPIETRA